MENNFSCKQSGWVASELSDVRMKGFSSLTRIDDALAKFFKEVKVSPLTPEEVPLLESLGRVLAEDIMSPADVPNFDRSAVDGYAVRAEDTYGASQSNPLVLDIVAFSEIGVFPSAKVGLQQAVRIATGAPMPEGADAVVMIEYTEKLSGNKIEIYRSVPPSENVSLRGEDVREGERILSKGVVIQPPDIGMFSALGLDRIRVVRKPLVAVLSSGNELVEAGSSLPVGKVFDSNRPTVMTAVRSLGAEPLDLGIVLDDLDAIKSKLLEGLAADMIIVSGATSVGEKDFLPLAINHLGKPGIVVHGISMRPGRPTALAAVDGKPVVLLPGFPVAAIISFDVFVIPILQRMLGVSPEQMERRSVRAFVSRRIASSLGNRTFARVIVRRMGEKYIIEPLRTSGSGVISSIVKANGMVVIPENKEGLEEGEEVKVIVLRPLKD